MKGVNELQSTALLGDWHLLLSHTLVMVEGRKGGQERREAEDCGVSLWRKPELKTARRHPLLTGGCVIC